MMLRVDGDDPVPIYEQVRGQVATMIASGALATGSRLPTIRQLANDLGLAKGTVSKAYEALERDGLVVTDGRKGTRVATAARSLTGKERAVRLAAAAEGYVVATQQLEVSDEEAAAAVQQALTRLGRQVARSASD